MIIIELLKVFKVMIFERYGWNIILQILWSLIDVIKNRYMYQCFLFDDVVLWMIYKVSDKLIGEWVNFKKLDNYLKLNFINNGVELFYYFLVIDKDGCEVYCCLDYEDGGSEDFYM